MHHPTDRIAHTTAFVTPVVEHWLEREIAQWVHLMKDRSDDPSHHERTLLPRSYISLPSKKRYRSRISNHWATIPACSVVPPIYSSRKHTVTYHFSDLQDVYSGNRQIHTKCQLQYLHPPQISTRGKCHCVIIHQTTKATEYTGWMSKYLHKSPLSHICTNHSLRHIHSVYISRCTSNSDMAIT